MQRDCGKSLIPHREAGQKDVAGPRSPEAF